MLLDWLDEAKIDRAGCFKYEPVKGARSNDLGLAAGAGGGQGSALAPLHAAPAEDLGGAAAEEGRQAPARASSTRRTALTAKGRTKYDAPEIDGSVHIQSRRPLRAGDIVTVKIERADAYDLYGVAT